MKTEKQKMLSGEHYQPSQRDLVEERRRAKDLCHRYNASGATPDRALLEELLGQKTDAYFEPPFFCDYGYNVRLGRGIYANHNLVILDCTPVTIGDGCLFGPNVVLSTATHPLDPVVRKTGLEFAGPIIIGNNVWIGANVTVMPGVEIGDDVTVGAGSVVTRSIPSRCVAAGNPCRVLKML